ncbi:MAG: hypothetical protein HYZ53_05605 [Planctomycetes bacterium]|nr:hypothetical protein [Planctomycetota bacterium]
MSEAPGLPTLSERDLEGLDLRPSGAVDLRRDIYRFVEYVREHGLARSVRGNHIPKTEARKLAKLLSWAGEAAAVELKSRGVWSDRVSDIARRLGLVSFDITGTYRGYTSSEPSFPDNDIEVDAKAWKAWLAKSPGDKESALLATLVDATANEFFGEATLLPGQAFDLYGSATGPAGAMKLPLIRHGLLNVLARLLPGVWYDLRGFVEWLSAEAPGLILDPDTRSPDPASEKRLRDWKFACERIRKGPKPPRPPVNFEDLYENFREPPAKDGWSHDAKYQLTTRSPDVFHRVEGRYVEFFLREIPYLLGFVDLAYRGARDRHGLDVAPPLERLRAFRLTQRFFLVLRKDPALDRVLARVLPNHEVLLEAPSYPDRELAKLAPFVASVKEEWPMHHLRLDRQKVVEAVAADPAHRGVAEVLEELTGAALPANVAAELAEWCGHGEKATLYEAAGLLQVRDAGERDAVRAALGDLVLDDRAAGYLIVRNPTKAFARLEEGGWVPQRVSHGESAFTARGLGSDLLAGEGAGPPGGRVGAAGGGSGMGSEGDAPTPGEPAPTQLPPRRVVRFATEDMVAYRCEDAEFLAALRDALVEVGEACRLLDGEKELLVRAAALPRVRAALRRVGDRFEIER